MSNARMTIFRLVVPLAASAAFAACGTSDGDGKKLDEGTNKPGQPGDDGFGEAGDVTSLVIEPATAAIEVINGAPATQPFKVTGKRADGASADLSGGVTWTVNNFGVGAIRPDGLYTASGEQGGEVTVRASFKGVVATAQLKVKLKILENPGSVLPNVQTPLKSASAPDAALAWLYPYDGTVFPRGLAAPRLMWNGGAPADAYLVRITSPHFELESYQRGATPSGAVLSEAVWTKFVESTAGNADMIVTRHDGTNATLVKRITLKVAPASMRGTIYYWANDRGRVMRIKPGAAAPDDFSQGVLPPSATDSKGTPHNCTMTCHSVSADGSTLISGGDVFGGTYDLLANAPKLALGTEPGTPERRKWENPAISPDGKVLLRNGSAEGLFDTATGALIPGTGFEGVAMWQPAFAPNGARVVYTDYSGGPNHTSLLAIDYDAAQRKAGTPRLLVPAANDPARRFIGYPSVSPDGLWAVYQRGTTGLDTRGVCGATTCDYSNRGDLYLASAVTPNQEIRLAAVNGDGYPFAAGARDLAYNYEPTFAPVAAGGYFWVVFTSRRTYGNLRSQGRESVKLLWVAAIDQNPTPGKDPSHPAFYLPAQEINTLNMRGFWALDPCKGDGQGCATGSECCGGYCDGSGGSGAKVCRSATSTCAQNGDRCEKTSDCCEAGSGTTCINHICSEAPPR
jgi:hypothetical protein